MSFLGNDFGLIHFILHFHRVKKSLLAAGLISLYKWFKLAFKLLINVFWHVGWFVPRPLIYVQLVSLCKPVRQRIIGHYQLLARLGKLVHIFEHRFDHVRIRADYLKLFLLAQLLCCCHFLDRRVGLLIGPIDLVVTLEHQLA